MLAAHAETTDPVGLERARNQIAVRTLRAQERPFRRLEDAAQDLFVHGRVRSRAELMGRVEAVNAAQVRDAFQRMLACRASVAIAGKVATADKNRTVQLFRDVFATNGVGTC